MTGARAETIHEAEVRPGDGGGFHNHRRPGHDFNNHHNEMEIAIPVHDPVRAEPVAIVHIAELTAGDEPQRARPQAPSPQARKIAAVRMHFDGMGGSVVRALQSLRLRLLN